MIDKENEVITRVSDAVHALYPSAKIDGSYQPAPSKFPHVSIYQGNSYTPPQYRDSSVYSKYEAVMFEVEVCSNKQSTKKTECKKIMAVIVDTMSEMNFRLDSLAPIPNVADSTIYRLTARFTGTVSADGFYSS